MARSNFDNPMLKVARAVGRDIAARQHLTQGASTRALPAQVAQSLTTRGGDGSEENPYVTRHAMFWGLDNWGEADWADAAL